MTIEIVGCKEERGGKGEKKQVGETGGWGGGKRMGNRGGDRLR